jgi:putative hydroxymethylpyrimidine transport system ATP-binding protein
LPLWNYTATESGASLGEVATTDNQSLSGRIAYMAQTDLLMPWLTVRDNVLIGYRLRGERVTTQVVERAMMLIEQVGLASVYMKKTTVLSGGMRQRVALARTLMENKPVVLMDEPFSALDAVTRFEIQTLAAQCLQGRTVLLVTHDPWEALRLADQILVLRGQPATLSIPLLPPQPIPRDLTDSALFDLQKTVLRELHMTGVVS